MKDGATMLFSNHPTAAEAAAITRPIHDIFNRRRHVTAAQEVGMQRMRQTIINGAARGHQRLTQNLPTKNLRRSDIMALTEKSVVVQLLQVQQLQQVSEHSIHKAPSVATIVSRTVIL
jgi:hypothetical protein